MEKKAPPLALPCIRKSKNKTTSTSPPKGKSAPASLLEDVEDYSKCIWFRFELEGYKDPYVLAERIDCLEPGDVPTDKPLVVIRNYEGREVALINMQCVFIDEAWDNGFTFRSISSEGKCFIKFINVVAVYVIRGYLLNNIPHKTIPGTIEI